MSFNAKTLDGAYDVEADNLTVNQSTDLKGTSLIEGPSTFLQNLNLENSTSNSIVSITASQLTTPSSDYAFNLPPTVGTAGQILKTDGSGNASWQTVTTTGLVSYIGITTPYPYLRVNGMGSDSTSSSLTFNLTFNSDSPIPVIYGGTGIGSVGTTGQVLTSNGSTLYWTTPTTGTVTSVTASLPLVSSGGSTPNISCSTTGSGTSLVLSDSPTLTGSIVLSGLTISLPSYTPNTILALNDSSRIYSKTTTGTGNVVLSSNPTLQSTIYADSLNLSPIKSILDNGSIAAVQLSLTGDFNVAGLATFTGSVDFIRAAIQGTISMYPSITLTAPAVIGHNFTGTETWRLGFSPIIGDASLGLASASTFTSSALTPNSYISSYVTDTLVNTIQFSAGGATFTPKILISTSEPLAGSTTSCTITPSNIGTAIVDLGTPLLGYNLYATDAFIGLDLYGDNLLSASFYTKGTLSYSGTLALYTDSSETNGLFATILAGVPELYFSVAGVKEFLVSTTNFQYYTLLKINGAALTSVGLDTVTFTTNISYNINTPVFSVNDLNFKVSTVNLSSEGLETIFLNTTISTSILSPEVSINGIMGLTDIAISISKFETFNITGNPFGGSIFNLSCPEVSIKGFTTTILTSIEFLELTSPEISIVAEGTATITTGLLSIEGTLDVAGDAVIGNIIADSVEVSNVTTGFLESGDINCGDIFSGAIECGNIDCADIIAIDISCVNITSIFDESAIFLGAPV